MTRLILFNKPYNVLSQFTDKGNSTSNRETLSSYIPIPGIYPAGRLDLDSEGLLLLTDDGRMQHQIAHPRRGKKKYYWVQVEGEIDDAALNQLKQGIQLNDGLARAISARQITMPEIWLRHPPIRERKNIPTSWIELVITEGRNRQVRRMTAAVGYPTLRLIRHRIDRWQLEDLQPGQYRVLTLGTN